MIQVYKIGGNVVDNPVKLEKFAKEFAGIGGKKILVHGGGAIASQLQKELGFTPVMISGRRVTDADTLRIVTMVYAGWCNKSIVALLQKYGCNAIGLSGADAGVIRASKRPPVYVESAGKEVDYGFVGDLKPEDIDCPFLERLLEMDLTPVFCAITCDKDGNLLNTNADTVASTVAMAISDTDETDLIYCFEKNGVLSDKDDQDSIIPEITPEIFEALKKEGTVSDGMLPKIENSFKAIGYGVGRVVIKNSDNISNDIQTVIKKTDINRYKETKHNKSVPRTL